MYDVGVWREWVLLGGRIRHGLFRVGFGVRFEVFPSFRFVCFFAFFCLLIIAWSVVFRACLNLRDPPHRHRAV